MEEKKSLKINFMGIVSILTLIVMGIGSTFAYFTASAKGKLDYTSVSSLEIVLNLKIGPLYASKPVLPTNDEDIEKAFANECLDDYGNGACYAYTVEIENQGAAQEGIATFLAESDSITNLKYMVLDNDNDFAIIKEPTDAMVKDEELAGIPIKLESENDKKIITIVVWLSNLKDQPQDHEQGGFFEGQVTFESTEGGRLTGTMDQVVIPAT